jgi:protein-S-isoprenylcysteine O-methyltransferase Ste14
MVGRALRWIFAGIVFLWMGYGIALPRFWVFGAITLATVFYISTRVDPTLLKERRRPAGGTVDPGALLAIRLSAIATLGVALLDIGRFHWSDGVPEPVRIGSMAVFALSLALVARAMVVNRFFSTAIRIQTDRHQALVTAGPYAIVRHPGYLGLLLALPAAALALGSWFALPSAVAYSALVTRRASVEDRYLQANLEDYAEYASRVRFRLIPGLW